MPKINQEEYEILKGLDGRWKWIARDDENQIYSAELYVFERKPEREDGYWNNISNGEYALLEERDDLFQFIQWEDEEPYEIDELIREYVINIIDQPDESEVLSQELPVIPKFVAEWYESEGKFSSWWNWFYKWGRDESRTELESKTIKWMQDYNEEKFVDIFRYGYEVEEEQKYYVDLDTAAYVAKWNGDDQVDIYTDDISGSDEFEFHLTEQEIKNYDARYWPFAKPVE